ncbi:MAG: FeoB-associated Cys-rich membrane protein [Oscillospiraceae bacterium]|nr:FeoB-associated Cys-rich membrane protein [Oscillospiraceae bacterium]MBQ8979069.1 FeoB-associated Cys-rich membrane protein [Oscillospiraceae bacterium]
MIMINVILIVIIAGIVVGLAVHMISQHRKGNDCSCGCEHCKQKCRNRK